MALARKKQEEKQRPSGGRDVVGLRAEVIEQPITDTLETNFMPYAMSVIVSRAIPEIDGFKPSQRKLLYTMYKMGLLTGARTKSANIVGQTMRLNPHGDAAIYDTMVRLSKGYEALLTPFVDSKGNFGKVYSRDMACAASRYTEAKLSQICGEIFKDIDRDTVDFADNYDNKMREPTLLPTSFPNVLVSANIGIAVGMASSVCGFNLAETCKSAIELLRNPGHDITTTLLAPDFPTGGELMYNAAEIKSIYETGRGGVKVRARWRYDKGENIIEITEIPYSTTAEAIIEKVTELVRTGRVREISDMRDETGLSGLKLTIDIKRGADPEKLMAKLFRMTPLMDSFSCNFNILVAGMPRVMGVREVLSEWSAWRSECVKRRTGHELRKKQEKLHLLRGLGKILLDIDRAIALIRNTQEESEVVPNLMIGFGIDEAQAEYVAEIKLRNINREYILKRTEETERLEEEIGDLREVLDSPGRVRDIIIGELEEVIKKYGVGRRTIIVYDEVGRLPEEDDGAPEYPVNLFLSREGYFKKITPNSLRMSGEQKYKESDGPFLSMESNNSGELLVFSDRQQVYKVRIGDFEDTKASALGTYLPSFLNMDEGEGVLYALDPGDWSGSVMFFFENGKAARVELSAYATKTNRKRLTGAYSDKSPVASAIALAGDTEVAVYSSDGRAVVFSTALVAPKATRATQGVAVMALRRNHKVESAARAEDTPIRDIKRYRAGGLPASGALLREGDREERQMEINFD
ncbi:MAG: topoisomerase IV [Oscillospiraceae bacterium]|jgi:DNA gyrase subunit A|nr:topoisomerase IV [Oscillospiraceae bacterium]